MSLEKSLWSINTFFLRMINTCWCQDLLVRGMQLRINRWHWEDAQETTRPSFTPGLAPCVVYTSWMPVRCYGFSVFPLYHCTSYSSYSNNTANLFPSPPTLATHLSPLCHGVFSSSDTSPSRFHVAWLPNVNRITYRDIEATLIKIYPDQNVKKGGVPTETHNIICLPYQQLNKAYFK
jgi:hypothetical protein